MEEIRNTFIQESKIQEQHIRKQVRHTRKFQRFLVLGLGLVLSAGLAIGGIALQSQKSFDSLELGANIINMKADNNNTTKNSSENVQQLNYWNASIHKGGYFGRIGGFESERGSHVILRTYDELQDFIADIMQEFRMDTAEVPPSYWSLVEKQVLAQYSQFDQEFFAGHDLTIVLIDQGSGSVKYEVKGVAVEDYKLIVDVNKDAPMIQTMDFISWVLVLETKNLPAGVTGVEIQI